MPKRGSREWFSKVGIGLTSGALALSVLGSGGGVLPAPGARTVQAEDIDCYNDRDLYDLPECVERRAIDAQNGEGQNEAQGAHGQQPGDDGAQQPGGNPPAGGGDQPPANNNPPAANNTTPPPAATEDEDPPEPPRAALTDPKQAVLTMADAGKEATQYISDEGTDKYGKFARTRYERDRSNGASDLGPNVMDSKVWVAKDLEAAKALFKEQSGIKNFPERKEGVQGPVEKIKPTAYGEEFSFTSGFYQEEKIWQHWRMVMRQGNVVAVVYLFGRESFFQDEKDGGWTGLGDWFSSTVFHRM